MSLPSDFAFSQGSLQDYVDCPRRFELRYVRRVAWPAIRSEPVLEHERYLQQGAAFHRLVHQHTLGIPVDILTETTQDREVRRWWRHYLESGPTDLPAARYPEVTLVAPLASHRLLAKYDLVALAPAERAVILDWKTSRRRLSRQWLAARLQSQVYPYLLVQAGHHLYGGRSIQPSQVTMIYWFADFPGDPERFAYDVPQHEQVERYLCSLIDEICTLAEAVDEQEAHFPLTSDERRCRYCPYRSLCVRGVQAGQLSASGPDAEGDQELDLGLDLDFEHIAEIEY